MKTNEIERCKWGHTPGRPLIEKSLVSASVSLLYRHFAAMSTSSSFPALLARSKFATYDPLISRVYTAPSSSSKRGDWGFKYTLPPSTSARPRPRYLKLEALAGEVKGGSYRSGEKEARFIERWGDGRVGWKNVNEAEREGALGKGDRNNGRRGELSGLHTGDVAAAGYVAQEEVVPQDKLQVPDIETMSEVQFEAYIEQIREMRARKGPAATPLAQTTAELESYGSKRIVERPHRLGGLAYGNPAGPVTRNHSPMTLYPGRVLQTNDHTANRDNRARTGGTGARKEGGVAGIGGLTAQVEVKSVSTIDFSRNSPDKGSALFRVEQATLTRLPSVVKDSRLSGTGSSKVKLAQDFTSRYKGPRESAIKATSPLDEMEFELNVKVADERQDRQKWGAGARAHGDKEWIGFQAKKRAPPSDGLYNRVGTTTPPPRRSDSLATAAKLQEILMNLNNPSSGSRFGESKREYHTTVARLADKPTASPSIDPKGSSPLQGPGLGQPKEGDGLAGGEWRELEENVAGEARHDEKLPGQSEKQADK